MSGQVLGVAVGMDYRSQRGEGGAKNIPASSVQSPDLNLTVSYLMPYRAWSAMMFLEGWKNKCVQPDNKSEAVSKE